MTSRLSGSLALVAGLSLWPPSTWAEPPAAAANLLACKQGRAACDRSRLSLAELTEVARADHARNVAECRNGRATCDISRLSQAETAALAVAGHDWHIFPNTVLLPMATNCLCYRSRPDGDNPDWCIFEVAQIERLPEAEVKKVDNPRNDDLQDEAFWGSILLQDFQQMEDTHRGMKSRGYRGPRLNPRQEASIENFHRVYHEYLRG